MCIAESLCCTPDANNIVYYRKIKILKKNKRYMHSIHVLINGKVTSFLLGE